MKPKDDRDRLELTDEEINALTEGIDFSQAEAQLYEKIAGDWKTTGSPVWREAENPCPQPLSGQEEIKARRGRDRALYSGFRWKWAAAAAAVLVLVLGGTAFAYQQGYLIWLFGPGAESDQVVQAAESQESGGVRMTLANVAYSGSEAAAVLAFERMDKKPFPDHVEFKSVTGNPEVFDPEHLGNVGNCYLSDDNRTLLYYLDFYGNNLPLKGQTISMEVSGIIGLTSRVMDLDLNLADLQDAYRADTAYAEGSGGFDPEKYDDARDLLTSRMSVQMEKYGTVSMPLAGEYPEIRFAGMGFLDNTLFFNIWSPQPDKIEQFSDMDRSQLPYAYVSGLRDSRTGEMQSLRGRGPDLDSANGEELLYTAQFSGITPDDLPYLTPVVTYQLKEEISDGKWGFSYTFEDDGLSASRDLDITFPNIYFPGTSREQQGGDYRLNRLELSAFTFTLSGNWAGEDPLRGDIPFTVPNVALLMRDGSEYELWPEIRGNDLVGGTADFKLRYRYPLLPGGAEGSLQFIGEEFMKQIESIKIGDQQITW